MTIITGANHLNILYVTYAKKRQTKITNMFSIVIIYKIRLLNNINLFNDYFIDF